MKHLEPIQLSGLLQQCPGKWVAIRGGEIIDVRDTFDQLAAALADKDIRNATIMRSPAEHEAELVGLG